MSKKILFSFFLVMFFLTPLKASNWRNNTSFETEISVQQNEITQSEYRKKEETTPFYLFHTGLYFGIIAMLLIVNFFFYFSLKDTIFLYYNFLIFITNFIIAYHENLLYPHIKNTLFQYDIDMFSHILSVIASYLFYKSFLNIEIYFPKMNKVIQYLIGINILIYIGFFTNNSHKWIEIGDNMVVILFLIFWILGMFLIKKVEYAKYLVIGCSVLIISVFFHIILQGIDLPIIKHSTNLIKIGVVLELIILTYATTIRFKILKEETEKMSNHIKNYITQVATLENTLKQKGESNNTFFENKIAELSQKYELTDRETDLLIQISKGLNNKQIADKLFISINTVKYHTRNLYEKLDVKKRTEITSKLVYGE